MHVHTHIYIHTMHIYVYIHTHVYVYPHTYTHMCVFTQTHMTETEEQREKKIESEIGRRICSNNRQEIPTTPGELASWSLRKVCSLFSVCRKAANSSTQRLSGRSPDLSFRKERVILLQAGLQSCS